MVVTVRWASDTARPATSVDFAACEAISPIEAASSSTELAAAVTLSEAAATRCSAVWASDDTVSAALLRSDELISSFIDAARSLPSTLSTECLNCAMVSEIVSLRSSCARLASACVCASFSRSIMVSRNTITVRAISPISSRAWVAGMRALVSPAASCFITAARPLSGRVMLRPISQLKAEAERDHGDADRDDAGAGMRLRGGERGRGRVRGLTRADVDDLVGSAAACAGCRCRSTRAADAPGRSSRSTFRTCRRRPSPLVRATSFISGVPSILANICGEFLVGGEELLTDQFAWIEPIFGFLLPHRSSASSSICWRPFSASQLMFSLMMRSTVLPAALSLPRRPDRFVESRASRCSCDQVVEVALAGPSHRCRSTCDIVASCRSTERGCDRCRGFAAQSHAPSGSSTIRSSLGAAVKSFTTDAHRSRSRS